MFGVLPWGYLCLVNFTIIYLSHMYSTTLMSAPDPASFIHYIDVIMTTIACQITSLTVVYSTVYSDTDQRKHKSSTSLAFVWGIYRDRWIPRTKGQLRGKCFHLITSSCISEMPLARKPINKLLSVDASTKTENILGTPRPLTPSAKYTGPQLISSFAVKRFAAVDHTTTAL